MHATDAKDSSPRTDARDSSPRTDAKDSSPHAEMERLSTERHPSRPLASPAVHDGRMVRALSTVPPIAPPIPLITTARARMLGVSVSTATHHRVRSGVHADRGAWRALPPWQQYAVRVHAHAVKNPTATHCLESAAAFHGLPLFGHPRDIHVYDPECAASRWFGDIAVHASIDPREVTTVAGFSVTSLVDTVVDLARVLPPAHALAVADAAVSLKQGRRCTVDELRERANEQANRRGRARLQWLWPRIDGRAESVGESVSRAVIEWCGFEEPELQREFHYEGYTDRVDFYFRSVRVIGESDGYEKYRSDDADESARLMIEEKRREDRLRRHEGGFARWDLAGALAVAPLREALVHAAVPQLRPPQRDLLATLRDASRSRPRSVRVRRTA